MKHIKPFLKHINMNSKFGSLEHPKLQGYIFHIVNVFNPYDDPIHNYNSIGSAKKYLQILSGTSTLKFTKLPYMFISGIFGKVYFKFLYLETESDVNCFDDGMPKPMKTKIYINKKNISRNNIFFMNMFDVICVEQNDKQTFGNCLQIDGPCNIIYDKNNYHEFGGVVRIETDSEVRFIKDYSWLDKIRSFLNVS